MKKGVQMYAVRSICKDDLKAGLKAVSEIGYDGVEFAGFFGHSAEEVASWLKEYGLEALGAHVPAEEIFDHPEETIAFHRIIGNRRIICPWFDLHTAEDVELLASKFEAVVEKYHAAGMKLYYHNHSHEFAKAGGSCLIDLLAERLPAETLSLEFDVYWVFRGGEDPLSYLRKYAGRVEIFHAKDGTETEGTAFGEGCVDTQAVCRYAKESGYSWAVIESEACEEPEDQLRSIRTDYQNLCRMLGE